MSRVKRTTEPEAAAARLWQEHLAARFPAALRGAELAGTDMVLLDADIAGCVSVWLNNGGALDTKRLGTLRDCIEDLDQVLPLLTEPGGLRYYQRLHQLALYVLAGSPKPTK
ncbi:MULTISPECIES: hypothetical protein [unclassified Streptomyces]|uniref:hypothetical protein n=1 Tax=unclassified Streptomyces TaxID=2593676 RepID=UPI002E1106F7|nr:hypothetical protein OG452_00490 [Streptomyces sp. NBC_01197]WSS53840.1 hypothetical protein OG708_34570 [Streptomyces sp. NBC_01180]